MKTKVKICGLTNLEDSLFCESIGIDFLGFNFVKSSPRYIEPEKALEITRKISKANKVGIFVNENIQTVNEIAEKLELDYVQLHGDEKNDYIKKSIKPVIKAFRIENNFPDLSNFDLEQIKFFLFDGLKNGESFNHNLLSNLRFKKDFFIAGGINEGNAVEIINDYKPYAIDLASSVEREFRKKDHFKISSLIDRLTSANIV